MHTRKTAKAFCEAIGTDYAIAESGASGPTFRPAGLDKGFAAIAVAARNSESGQVDIVRQDVVRSPHADRETNMRLFADAAATLAYQAVTDSDIAASEDEGEGINNTNEVKTSQPIHHLDRATNLRSDPEMLNEMAHEANYILLHGGSALFRDGWDLALLSLEQVQSICNETDAQSETTFLGLLDDKTAFFGVDLIGENSEVIDEAVANVGDGAAFADTRTGAPLLSPIHNELVLHATALAQWQRRAPFCSACGGPTTLIHGGTCRRCSACGALSWPRQDPSMIAVITNRDGQKVLLARSQRHPPRMHTALAGFVEAGETFEKAVAREVYEEAGVRIDLDSVSYVGSQPWPFPQSTMIGFIATADEEQALNIDEDEIVEARWFGKEEVRAAASVPGAVMRLAVAEAALKNDPSLPLLIPPKGVLARQLMDTWLDRVPL